jgi:hypothetical protein
MTARAMCPACGQYRSYTIAAAARRAERKGKRCHRCANQNKNNKTHILGFSEAEFNSIKTTAKNRKKYWDLSITDIHDLWEAQDGKCAMTGAPLQKVPRTWSIDRLDNACGYTPSNVQLVLKHVNMMRGSLTPDDFVTACMEVVIHRSRNETD